MRHGHDHQKSWRANISNRIEIHTTTDILVPELKCTNSQWSTAWSTDLAVHGITWHGKLDGLRLPILCKQTWPCSRTVYHTSSTQHVVRQTLAKPASPFRACPAWKWPSPKSHLIHFLLAFVQIRLLPETRANYSTESSYPSTPAAAYPEIFSSLPPIRIYAHLGQRFLSVYLTDRSQISGRVFNRQ